MKRDYDDLPESVRETLQALQDMPDSEIDLSDIPETTDFSNALRGVFYRPVKKQVTLRLDSTIIAWFKLKSNGRGYQTLINNALQEYIQQQENKAKSD